MPDRPAQHRPRGSGRVRSRVRDRNSRRILAAVGDLVEGGGIEQASMRQLADTAGVSVRTLYNLFDDREGLVRALVLDSIVDVNLAVGALRATDPIERAWEAVEVALDTVITSLPRAVLVPVLDDPDLLLQLAQHWDVSDVLVAEIRRAQHDGDLVDDLDADALVDQVGVTLLHLLRGWASGRLDDEALVAGTLHALDVCLLAIAPADRRAALSEHARRQRARFPATTPGTR